MLAVEHVPSATAQGPADIAASQLGVGHEFIEEGAGQGDRQLNCRDIYCCGSHRSSGRSGRVAALVGLDEGVRSCGSLRSAPGFSGGTSERVADPLAQGLTAGLYRSVDRTSLDLIEADTEAEQSLLSLEHVERRSTLAERER